MGEFALYKAVQSFTPPASEEDALAFNRDDVFQIPVHSPCIDSDAGPKQRKGWLYAFNRCTGAEGYVKVEHVKLLGSEINYTIHHPSAPGLEGGFPVVPHSSYNGSGIGAGEPHNGHRTKEVHFLTPILCKHCTDYIWGTGKVGQQCEVVNWLKPPRPPFIYQKHLINIELPVMKTLRLVCPLVMVKVDHHGCRHNLTNHNTFQKKHIIPINSGFVWQELDFVNKVQYNM